MSFPDAIVYVETADIREEALEQPEGAIKDLVDFVETLHAGSTTV